LDLRRPFRGRGGERKTLRKMRGEERKVRRKGREGEEKREEGRRWERGPTRCFGGPTEACVVSGYALKIFSLVCTHAT